MAEEPTTDDKTPVALTMAQIKDMFTGLIDERIGAVKELTPQNAPGSAEQSPKAEAANVGDQVKAALERLHKQEAREKRENGWDVAIEELRNALKPSEDTPPIERRKVHKIMGWGEPDK